MRIVLLSDIHGNFEALKAVENKLTNWLAEREKNYWFLGDLVGYGPSEGAIKCVDWLITHFRESKQWVPGNHDAWLWNPGEKYANHQRAKTTLLLLRWQFNKPENKYYWNKFSDLLAEAFQERVSSKTGRLEQKNSLKHEYFDSSGQQVERKEGADLFLTFTHASVLQDSRQTTYLYPGDDSKILLEISVVNKKNNSKYAGILYGHTHFPVFARLISAQKIEYQSIRYGQPISLGDKPFLINPGSVGQPRDGDPRASFAILDTTKKEIVFHRVEYNRKKTIAQLHQDSNQISQALEDLRAESDDYLKDTIKELLESPEKPMSVFDGLEKMLKKPDGGIPTQNFSGKVYLKPKWDLEARRGKI